MKTFLAIVVLMGAAVLPVEDPILEDERGPSIDYRCLPEDVEGAERHMKLLDAICEDGEHDACYLSEAIRNLLKTCKPKETQSI